MVEEEDEEVEEEEEGGVGVSVVLLQVLQHIFWNAGREQ